MRWTLLLLLAACASAPKEAGPPAAKQPEGPALSIAFEGLQAVDEDTLRRAAAYELAQFERQGRRPADLADAAFKMSLVFFAGGFPHADVRFQVEDERVVFIVAEGPRAYLGDVTFTGREALSEAELRAMFLSSKAKQHDGRRVYTAASVDGGVGGVLGLYHGRGYYRARVGPAEVTWNAARTRADVVVPVFEGRRYRLVSLRTEGEIPPEARGPGGDLPAPEFFQAPLPYQAAARVRGRLLNAGYRGAVVRPEVIVDDADATVEVILHVSAGVPFRLRKVIVKGRDRTRPRFVRTRIPAVTGDIIRETDLEKAREDLYATNLFKRVRIRTTDPEGDQADLEVEIEEYVSRSVTAKAGWGSYELLRGALIYEDLNFTGRGQVLTLEVTGSLKGYGIGGAFLDKYVLGRGWDIAVRAGYEFRAEPTFDRSVLRGSVTFIHELARYERPWPQRPRALDLTIGYLYDAERADNITGPIAPAEQSDFVVSAGLVGALDYDSLDDPLFPKNGIRARAGLFWSAPVLGAELDYIEVTLSFSIHRELRSGTVLSAGVQFATRNPLDGSVSLPVQQRLFLGGSESVRSFQQDRLSPPDADGDPLGGLTSAEFSLELRQRLTGGLHAAIFYDVGTVSVNPWSASGEAGHGVGAGLRYYLPIGPVRLDVAYNPGPLLTMTTRWVFHFAFGFSF